MYKILAAYGAFLVGILLAPWLIDSLDRSRPPEPRSDDGLAEPTAREQCLAPLPAVGLLPPLTPLPREHGLDVAKIALGQMLFNDPRLSSDESVSCQSCHNLLTGGVDRLARSVGAEGFEAPLNTPTVFNAGHNYLLLWSGRFENLESQIDQLVEHSKILNTSWHEVIEKLQMDLRFSEAFRSSYPQGLTSSTARDALAIYQRSLITPDSPFDRFLRGDESALTTEQQQGFEKFKSHGCISCHQGVNIGGNLMQPFGILKDYYPRDSENLDLPEEYFGRFNVTGDVNDKFVYRVPGLRNVALTPPYFHDGSAETLEEAVRTMAEYQLGLTLGEEEVRCLVLFLETLSGSYAGTPLGSTQVGP